MTKIKGADVVIVGAGLAGATLALALSGNGLSILLVESNPLEINPLPTNRDLNSFDLRVSALTVRSKDLLERIGIWQSIRDYRICPYRHMKVWDAEGTGQIEFDCSLVGALELGTIVENRAIISELLREVHSRTDIALIAPDTLEEHPTFDSSNTLNITLTSGERISGKLLVATDGSNSNVRKLMGFATKEWDYDQKAIVATVRVEKSHQSTAWQRFMCTGPLAFLPLPQVENANFCSIVWSCDDWLAQELMALNDKDFCEKLSFEFEYMLGNVLASSKRAAFPLRQCHATSYYKELVALAGDAAHTIHPLAGQGINIGFKDVEVLAEEVIQAHRSGIGIGSIDTLARYQRRRKAENLQMMLVMDGFKRLFGSRKMQLRWLRNFGLKAVNSNSSLKKQIIRYAMGVN